MFKHHKPRPLERYLEIAAYLKVRRAREQRRQDIDLAWGKYTHGGPRLPRLATRRQLIAKHAEQNAGCASIASDRPGLTRRRGLRCFDTVGAKGAQSLFRGTWNARQH
jgi:hypothetical protein